MLDLYQAKTNCTHKSWTCANFKQNQYVSIADLKWLIEYDMRFILFGLSCIDI